MVVFAIPQNCNKCLQLKNTEEDCGYNLAFVSNAYFICTESPNILTLCTDLLVDVRKQLNELKIYFFDKYADQYKSKYATFQVNFMLEWVLDNAVCICCLHMLNEQFNVWYNFRDSHI